jgi:8-oxo-dGTP pyrophosphatase MutT (NUDIX family)
VTDEPAASPRTRWTIHGERLVAANPHVRLSLASVELPSGKLFEQYVFRIRRSVMTAVVDDPGERLLLIWRHRFIADRWEWEIPGGYVDPGEEPSAAAAREVEEETGWRPRAVEFMLTFQPAPGSADAPQDLYLARGADLVGEPDADETEAVRWVRIDDAREMIRRGELLGAATVIAVLHLSVGRPAPSGSPGVGG